MQIKSRSGPGIVRILTVLCWGLTVLSLPADEVAQFFVAPDGNDAWSGKSAAPNWLKSNGPFATLPRALVAARSGKTPATIFFRGGTYFLGEPLRLTPPDSGLTIAAYKTETPILSGGRRIAGWKEVTVENKKLWAADLPETRDGKWVFRELWVNGQRATRARHPNTRYLEIEAGLETQQSKFRFKAGDIKNWPSIAEAEMIIMNRWVESRLPIVKVEETDHVILTGKRSVFQCEPHDPYYLEGAWEFLDAPGEWYLDRQRGTLFYWPRPGEQLAKIDAIAPVLEQIVRLEGKPEEGQFLEKITFRGLTFAHAEWYFPRGFADPKDVIWPPSNEMVGGFAQAAVGVPGAVWGEGVRNCTFENCALIHLGTYALELSRGCTKNRIVGCELSDLGAGGIKIGERKVRETGALQTQDNEVSDCSIHDGGKLFASAIGIWIGESFNNRLVHNEIHDFYYTGISLGWTWGYGPSTAGGNLVEFNHVHHIGVLSNGDGPILSDMGGIYTLGGEPGTLIRNNLWHDIAGHRYGGWGIYFDEGSSGIIAENNLVYRTTHGGLHQHYGKENIVRNNIFAFGRDWQLQRSRQEPHRSFTFEHNIVYWNEGPLLGGGYSEKVGEGYQFDHNLYFNTKSLPLRLGQGSWEQWQKYGQDTHSLVADPLFQAPTQNNFKLAPNSPASQVGFQPFDLSSVGPRVRAPAKK